MSPIYLRFEDENEAITALDGMQFHQIEYRGLLPSQQPIPGVETPMYEGWHVDILDESIPQELEVYRVYPVTPNNVWAGHE